MPINITEHHKLIFQGLVCPYCKLPSVLVDSAVVYGEGANYGWMYYCGPCKAYAGCHKGTKKALGRLANEELRKWKIEAHKYFDMLWRLGFMKRSTAYKRLSKWLDIPKEYTHIGMFSVKTCKEVVIFAKTVMNDERRLDLDFGADPKTEYFEID